MAGGRPSGEKTRCNGQWTEARYRSFVQSLLRQGTRRWAPVTQTEKDARVSRGVYECATCKQHVPPTKRVDGKRVKNTFVDHIEPIVDPAKGFEGFDPYIEKMFCEMGNLQLLCKVCHDEKTAAERAVAVERRRKEREQK